MRRLAALLLLWSFGCASGLRASEPVRDALTGRFTLSRIEVQNPCMGGRILSRGSSLILQMNGVPAKQLRIIQPNPKLPRVHVRDYALVEVAQDGGATMGPGESRLAMGTRLAVLDLKVAADRVHLFTHTIEPVSRADGPAGAGAPFLRPPEAPHHPVPDEVALELRDGAEHVEQ